jgi:hypothetical protein
MSTNVQPHSLFDSAPGFDWLGQPADQGNPAALQAVGASSGHTVLYAPDGGSVARLGGGGSGGTTTTTAPSTTSTSASALVINITWDASVATAPSSFTAGVLAAVSYLESQFSDPVTLNINVGYGEVGGTTLGSSALGSSETYLTNVSYAALKGAVTADATSATDQSVAASLPASSPIASAPWVTTAQAEALGLASASGTGINGYVGFSSTLPFDYDTSNGVSGGTYDFNAVVLHELTEVMGRQMLTGATIGSVANSYDLYDLLHYSAPGVRDFSASTPGYLSADGGVSNTGTFNTASGGDAGDWASAMGNDAADAFANSGVVNAFSAADLAAMDMLGWNLGQASAPAPTGVAVTPITSALGGAQGASGLTAGAALAGVTQVGGATGDSFVYVLGGSGAASFSLVSAANAATLSAGSGGVAGAAGGHLYALSLTATDTTASVSAPASALDVIVGAAGADTISIASLTGSLATATPSFVYGLAGADSINGTGMTGRLYLDGGAGADRLTGGSGVNDYLYGAAKDSTAAAMDVITNFHAASDLIDLTGLGSTLADAGKFKGNTLAAHSVGWQTSGGNTFVYVNASAGAETLTATDMKIGLAGNMTLSSGNLLHL